MTKLFIASDHAGVELKGQIINALLKKEALASLPLEVHDLGPHSLESVDYPDYADLVCEKIHGFSLLQAQPEKSLQLHLS